MSEEQTKKQAKRRPMRIHNPNCKCSLLNDCGNYITNLQIVPKPESNEQSG